MDREGGTKRRKQEGRCPTLKEVFGYTSVVIVLLAILLPIEMNIGIIGFLRKMNVTTKEKETLGHFILAQLGVLTIEPKTEVENRAEEKIPEMKDSGNERVFTKEELKKYSGDNKLIYLAYLGHVYDVTKGRKHYGKDGSYSFFAGKDGTRAFVTGQFDEKGLIDNIEGLEPANYLGLMKWKEMYEKEYTYVGKLEGFFYDKNGKAAAGMKVLEEGIKRGEIDEKNSNDENAMFPNCNSYYTPETGAEVWCSKKSGGIIRDWTGLPRRFFKLGAKSNRCACVKNEYLSDPRFKEYKGCPSDSVRCKVID